MLAWGILFIVAFSVFWVYGVEPNWFRLRRKTVRIGKPLAKPLTLLHLSDFHFTGPRFFLERFFDRLARLDPDLIFITGDLIDGPKGIRPCVRNLKKLKPRHGSYAVLGNHDYREYPLSDQRVRLHTGRNCGRERRETEPLKKALARAGVRLLLNENVSVKLSDGREVTIVGIDDPVTGRSNFKQAFEGIKNGALRLALIHAPASFPVLSKRGVDLAFAGHTHGGQIRVPGMGPLPIVRRLERVIDSTDRFGFTGLVSRGLGANPLLSLRFFCRPEAVLVRIEG